jgi:hypothetical protein
MSDFHKEPKRVVTKADHPCEGCGATIVKGANAVYHEGFFDGDVYYFWLCQLCADYVRRNPEDFEEGFHPGEIGDARKEETA